jgi:mono/diheme cytochrome c family protein
MTRHILLICLLVLASCSKKMPTQMDDTTPPDATVTFSGTIQPMFNARCVSCHSASVPQSGVNLTSYASTMASRGSLYNALIVVTGNADQSALYDKLLSSPRFGSRMPQGGSLTTQQIANVRAWINAGAPNN